MLLYIFYEICFIKSGADSSGDVAGVRLPTPKFAKHGLSAVDLCDFRLKLKFLANFTTKDICIAPTLEEYFKNITSKFFSPRSARPNFYCAPLII